MALTASPADALAPALESASLSANSSSLERARKCSVKVGEDMVAVVLMLRCSGSTAVGNRMRKDVGKSDALTPEAEEASGETTSTSP